MPVLYWICLSLPLLPGAPALSFTSLHGVIVVPYTLWPPALCAPLVQTLKIGYCLEVQKLSLGFICVAVLFAGMLGIELGALHALGICCPMSY